MKQCMDADNLHRRLRKIIGILIGILVMGFGIVIAIVSIVIVITQ